MLRISKEHFLERQNSVKELLVGQGLEGLVVFAHGSALGWGTQTHPYMRWLCDWDGLITPSVLVMPVGEAPVLLTPQMFLYQARGETSHLEAVRYVRREDFGRAIAEVLGGAQQGGGRFAFVGRNECPVLVWESVAEAMPTAELVDFTPELSRLIIQKGDVELALCQHAAGICDLIFERLGSEIRSGKPAFQIKAELERVGAHEGCEHCLTWLTVAPDADYARLPKNACTRIPAEGDQVILGIYLMFEGVWGHAIRTGNIGAPSRNHAQLFEIVLEMQEAALGKLRPGADLRDVQDAFEAALMRHFPHGLPAEHFRFTNAHGMGSFYSEPITSDPFPQPYEAGPGSGEARSLIAQAGMVFQFHPNIFIPGTGSAALGDMVQVDSDGCHLLTRYPRELVVF